jgi:hypothetical protein
MRTHFGNEAREEEFLAYCFVVYAAASGARLEKEFVVLLLLLLFLCFGLFWGRISLNVFSTCLSEDCLQKHATFTAKLLLLLFKEKNKLVTDARSALLIFQVLCREFVGNYDRIRQPATPQSDRV